MRKFLLFAASLMVSVCSFAQWVKPAAPEISPMAVGEELYLYNSEADGFLLGANDWGTRASVSPTLGHKVYLEAGTVDGSYYITNYVLEGGMANQIGYMFLDDLNGIWVDNTKDGKANNQYTFVAKGDGTYKIGLSAANAEYNPTNYPDAYLGVIPAKEDTRLYFCDPENSEGYSMDDCLLTWYFVAPAAYEAYSAAMKQYLAAVELGKVLEKAATVSGVDATVLASAQAAYGNQASTAEELQARATALAEAVQTAKLNEASLDNPVEVLANQGIATDFSNGPTGWSSTTGAQNKGADNGNNAKDYSVTGNHYENWNWDAFSVGKVTATATDLPTGVYRLNALAFANVTGTTYLYAGESQKLVEATNIDVDQEMEVFAFTANGQMSVGLDVQAKAPNWIGLDNVYLYFVGTSTESYQKLIEETLMDEPDYEALFAEGEAYCQQSVYQTYKEALDNFKVATTTESMTVAYPAFMAASKALAANVAAYKVYVDLVEEANEFRATTASDSEEVTLLSDYLDDDTNAEGLYNGNGGAEYILTEGVLDNAQITAEAAYLDRILSDAKANSKADGDDCTDLLKNPNFAEQGGWTSAVGPVWPAGNQETFPVMEVQNMLCNVYQELTNLQNGLYEFSLQGVFRASDGYSDETVEDKIQAYAYINSFETKIPSGKADLINSADEASTAFAAEKYPVKVYGLVTDGTMKIGITNRLRTADGCYLWAGGAKLIFRAKNADVLAQVINETMPKAEALQNNYAGNPELTALANAIFEAQDPEDAYDALIALKSTMEAVEAGTTTYANLAVALKSLADAIENNTTASVITIKNAQAVLEEAQAAYDEQSYSTEEAEQAINDVNAAAVSIKMGGDIASEDNPVDYSSVIVNNNFDPERGSKDAGTIEGWTTTSMNGYKQFTVSYNRAPFELNQKLSGLPKGKYKVTVHTYYRAGYYNEEESRIAEGVETHLTTLYAETSAETFTKPVMNLSEGADADNLGVNCYTLSSGLFAPDGTTPTAAWFAAGRYLNELVFTVPEDGEVTIGLSKTETFANDYEVVGEWNLWYMGDEAAKADTIDMTDVIINPTFDPEKGSKDEQRIEGWTTTAMNGYKQFSVSYNRAPFELYQDLSGLPAGKYYATVHTYYRAGYYNEEEERIAEGVETHLTTLYAETSAKTYTTPVMNLTEGADADNLGVNCYTLSSGLFAPDGTTPTVAWFAAGRYLNKIEFTVPEDGKVRIGLSKTETFANDYEVVGEWKLYYLGAQPEIEETDVTDLIVNPNFDPAKGDKNSAYIEGWTTTALNGYKEYTASYNRTGFELNQKLTGLREGTYKVTVHTYYRAGYWNEEEEHIAASEDTHLTTLYAQTTDKKYSVPVMNLTEGATTEAYHEKYYTLSSGLFAPDGTSPTAAWFAAGAYLNELLFYVGSAGEVTIGLSKTETFANDYQVVGAWNLYYYGSGNNVDDVVTGITITDAQPVIAAQPVSFYSISGTRLAAPQKGINIVKMSDGSIRKVLVK